MALRLAALRRFATPPAAKGSVRPLGLDKGFSFSSPLEGFSFSAFFEEKHFWNKANVGPFFLLLFFTPTIYRSFKDMYWTRQLRKLNTEEIISDRYEWLKLNMIKDEVEGALLEKVPAGGFQPLQLGPSTPP